MKVQVGRYAYFWEGDEPLVPGDRVLLPENWLSPMLYGHRGPFEDTVTAIGRHRRRLEEYDRQFGESYSALRSLGTLCTVCVFPACPSPVPLWLAASAMSGMMVALAHDR